MLVSLPMTKSSSFIVSKTWHSIGSVYPFPFEIEVNNLLGPRD